MKEDASKTQTIAVKTSCMTTVRANPALVHEHWEPLSSLDIFIPKEDVDVILCYEKPNVTFDSMVATLKRSLAETLVEYYVFGGELAFNESSSELEILCNNHGVEFVEASVDLEFKELDLYKPHEVLDGKLTSKRMNGTFSVQVTEFVRCGSIVVACKFHHTVADGYSTNMFLISWYENAISKALSHPPSRLIFHPRSPPKRGQNVEKYFYPLSSLPPPFIRKEQDTNTSRVYYITADQTIAIQEAASTMTSKRTKLESFSAYLWQLLSKSAFQENSYTTNTKIKRKDLITKMGIVVDGRTRLASMHEPQSCISYFGNVVSAPYGSETLDTISNKPLTWVAEKVAQVIKVGTNKDHFLDLIDLVDTIHPEITVPENFWPRSTDGPKVVVSSGLRFLSKIDFGWGRPLLGFYCLPWEVDSGYVMPVQTPNGNGDWIVYMHLQTHQIKYIEKEASHVFKPLTLDLVHR